MRNSFEMKKLDKLILKSFIGPFILTFFVVVFILLIIHISKYFDELVGKNLGWDVLSELFLYFGLFNTPIALPLAVLLSSLMTFGNLGEHSEIVALKSAGISLTRALLPIFIFVSILTVIAFFNNNYLVPKAALNAYSLIYDIKRKKPALDLKEGTFYNGIPNYSIKVKEKLDDDKTLKDLIIYDHSKGLGNREVILADSGIMYTILNDRYLKLELYNGRHYSEGSLGSKQIVRYNRIAPFTRTEFAKSEIVFDLSSFDLKRTKKELFSNDRLTRNFHQLRSDVDSIENELIRARYEVFHNTAGYFKFHLKNDLKIEIPQDLKNYKAVIDSLRIDDIRTIVNTKESPESVVSGNKNDRDTVAPKALVKTDTSDEAKNTTVNDKDTAVKKALDAKTIQQLSERMELKKIEKAGVEQALNMSRQIKSRINGQVARIEFQEKQYLIFKIQYLKMIAHAFACMVMFLIGAPLGSIIKRGGLGVPVLFSIIFFIIFYVLYITGENYAKEGQMQVVWGVWMSNLILLPIGLFFLRQARHDARLFDADYYMVTLMKVKNRIGLRLKRIKSTVN